MTAFPALVAPVSSANLSPTYDKQTYVAVSSDEQRKYSTRIP